MTDTQIQINNIFIALNLEWKGYNFLHDFKFNGRDFTAAAIVESKYDRNTGQKTEVTVIKVWTKVISNMLVFEIFFFKEKEIKLHVPPRLLGFVNDIIDDL